MGVKSSIEWTDSTWSALRARVRHNAGEIALEKGYSSLVEIGSKMAGRVGQHCEPVSDGCKFCYSGTWQSRCLPVNGTGLPFDRRSRDLIESIVDEKALMLPLRWRSSTICEFALLRLDLADARAQVAALRNVCAEAYQFAGAVGAPVAVLDNLSDAAQGQALRHETFLPVLPEDCAEVAALTAERDALQVELAAAKQDTARLDWLFGEEATFLQIPNIYRMERRLMVPWADASTAGQEYLAQGVGPTPPQAKTEEA